MSVYIYIYTHIYRTMFCFPHTKIQMCNAVHQLLCTLAPDTSKIANCKCNKGFRVFFLSFQKNIYFSIYCAANNFKMWYIKTIIINLHTKQNWHGSGISKISFRLVLHPILCFSVFCVTLRVICHWILNCAWFRIYVLDLFSLLSNAF